MDTKWDERLVDVVAAWYASQGDTECQALNEMKFRDVLNILHTVPKLYPDLVARSAAMRLLRGGMCHMDCHVTYMLKEERSDDNTSRTPGHGSAPGSLH